MAESLSNCNWECVKFPYLGLIKDDFCFYKWRTKKNHKARLNKKQEYQPHYIEMGLNKSRNIIKKFKNRSTRDWGTKLGRKTTKTLSIKIDDLQIVKSQPSRFYE